MGAAAMICTTLGCTRKALSGWLVCGDCRRAILEGHLPGPGGRAPMPRWAKGESNG